MKFFGSVCTLLLVTLLHQTLGQIRFPGSSSSGGGAHSGGGGLNFSPKPNPQQTQDKGHSTSGGAGTNACNCVAANACPTDKGQAKHGCYTEQKSQGICCQVQEGATTTRNLGSSSPINLPNNVVQEGVKRGQSIVSRINQQTQNNLKNGNFLRKRTAARGHAYFFRRNPSAVAIHKQAYQNARASAEISKMQKLSPGQAPASLTRIQPDQQLRTRCPADDTPRCDQRAKFRTIDGSCNNLRNPNLGKSETALARLTVAIYNDGVMEPRTLSIDESPLRSPREISNAVLLDVNNPSAFISLNVMQWAQFIDHDLTHVPFEDMDGQAIQCCENGRTVRDLPEQCFPIQVSPGDGFFREFNEQCINFVRSMLALRPGCGFGPAEQINALTHWLDGSMIYGSIESEATAVREPRTPFLAVSRFNLPPTNSSIDCEARVPRTPCFVAGDSRVNEQPGLTAMHTIWLREHNRIAETLQKMHSSARPDIIFEEARRIVVAQVQHIVYTEWLPLLVGPQIERKFNLRGPTSYDAGIDPAQFNEFATAAFRFGHSLVQGVFFLPSATNRITTLRLRDTFNNPGYFQENPDMIDSFVRALAEQPSQNLDSFITEDLSNHLFEIRGTRFGMDLMSLNIQRGRDHGIGTYVDLRRRFNIGSGGQTRDFLDLRQEISEDLIKRLQSVYEFVEDIDLFAGGMSESPVQGGILGPTFANILAVQFSNLRHGDRFFYDVQGQPGSFSSAQLREIQKSSLAKVYCDNSNVASMQPNAFLNPDHESARPRNPSLPNLKQPCNSLPGIDLGAWR